MKKVLLVVVGLGLGLMSCEKPELDSFEQIASIEVKGWKATKFIDNNDKHNLTGKSTTVDYTIEVYETERVLFTTPEGTEYKEALIYDGTPDNDDYIVYGSVVYAIDVFDGVEYFNATINMNDKDGNPVGDSVHIEPTTSFEIKFLN